MGRLKDAAISLAEQLVEEFGIYLAAKGETICSYEDDHFEAAWLAVLGAPQADTSWDEEWKWVSAWLAANNQKGKQMGKFIPNLENKLAEDFILYLSSNGIVFDCDEIRDDAFLILISKKPIEGEVWEDQWTWVESWFSAHQI